MKNLLLLPCRGKSHFVKEAAFVRTEQNVSVGLRLRCMGAALVKKLVLRHSWLGIAPYLAVILALKSLGMHLALEK